METTAWLKRYHFNISVPVCVTNLQQISALFGSLKVWDNICNIRWRSLELSLLFVAQREQNCFWQPGLSRTACSYMIIAGWIQ